jgi:hypothetical protein
MSQVIEEWPDAYGQLTPATPAADAFSKPFYIQDAVGGRPAIEFYSFSSSITLPRHNALSFSGAVLENTDYTVFAVVAFPESVTVFYPEERQPSGWGILLSGDNLPGWTITGSESADYRNVGLGSPRPGEIGLFHPPDELSVTAPAASEFKVYAYRFSQSEGSSIYINGVLYGSNAANVTPVSGFSGAAMGSLGAVSDTESIGRRTQIADLEACGVALPEEELEDETRRLRIKYGL